MRVRRRVPGYVYAIYCPPSPVGRIKIGFTERSARGRLKDFQTGNPERLELLYAWPVDDGAERHERLMHDLLAGKRYRGEWFTVSEGEALKAWSLVSGERSLGLWVRFGWSRVCGWWRSLWRVVEVGLMVVGVLWLGWFVAALLV